MKFLPDLFERNREWAATRLRSDPAYFTRLCSIQRPDLLWIGCSDSRVPANEITGRAPGELFVHRNVSNIVPLSDINAMAVLEFGVRTLGVGHIIVCGHYRCGGVRAALENDLTGAAGLWLQPVRVLAEEHEAQLATLPNFESRWDRLCELNVVAQVRNVASSAVVTAAWTQGAQLAIHGWIYDLKDGLLRDLDVTTGIPPETRHALFKAP